MIENRVKQQLNKLKAEQKAKSKKRKSFNSEVLALSGIDYARAIIEMNNKANELEINDTEDDFMKSALYVKKGLKSSCSVSITNMGSFDIIIESA